MATSQDHDFYQPLTTEGHPGPPPFVSKPAPRPTVDPAAAQLFGRPPGVLGAFADQPGEATGEPAAAPPTPEALAAAFGRPSRSDERLQRPPGRNGSRPSAGLVEDGFWPQGAGRDPWRDPWAAAVLGAPAVGQRDVDADEPPRPGARLSVAEVLFGRRLSNRALATLAAVALLIGGFGGLVGRLTAEGGTLLNDPGITLAQVQPSIDRPAGSVAAVAGRVLPAVVSLEYRVGDQGGFGSGVVIDGHGYVLTNNHVVAPAADIPHATLEAVFSDGTRLPARIVGRDPKTDLAVVKVEVVNPTVAQLGRSSALKPGDPVIAIGSPLGLAGTVTSGIVSAVNRPVRLEAEGSNGNAVIDAIQTDAAINPGNSGGALVDGAGAVVGINTAIRTLGAVEGGGSIGLGFAIPIDTARTIAQELIRTGHYQHADLGVNAASVTDGKSDGARVQNVQQGSAAAEAGILENDVITKVGNRTVGTADALTVAIRERAIGERVPISLVRDGRPLVVTVALKSD
ncbi:MAG: serine protease [Pseudonocardiales bacterium]|nr:trypsin-like peptidase domain-containing protein [Actinomycetota bacterium]PZS22942.1 MAG: serine protease [Pseudonocardiales bacterium]